MTIKNSIFVIIALLIFVAFGLSGCSNNENSQNKANKQTGNKVVFDIPSLLDKDADQIKNIIGEPDFEGEHFGNSFKSLEWKKNNYEFRIDLNPSGSIRNQAFMIFGYVEKRAIVKSTIEAGNLDIKSKKYEVLLDSDGTIRNIISIYIKPRK